MKADDTNPYRVSPGSQVEIQASAQMSAKPRSSRSPVEWIVLASLVVSLLSLVLTAMIDVRPLIGSGAIGVVSHIGFVIFGISSLCALWLRSAGGPVVAMIFYGIQVFRVTFLPSGFGFHFVSVPTLFIRLVRDPTVHVDVNTVAVILLLLSVRVWREYADEKSDPGDPSNA